MVKTYMFNFVDHPSYLSLLNMCFFSAKRATVPLCLRSSRLMMVAQHILHTVADHWLRPGWMQKLPYSQRRKAKLSSQNKDGVAACGHCDPPAIH